jgi:hypothetical protein
MYTTRLYTGLVYESNPRTHTVAASLHIDPQTSIKQQLSTLPNPAATPPSALPAPFVLNR